MFGWLGAAASAINPVAAIGTLAAGAGKLIGAKMSSDAADDAAKLQADATNRATALQERMYKQSRSDYEPYRAAGARALSDLGNPDFQRDFQASDFQKDPGYDFRMQEGAKALQGSAAARGSLLSGGTLKALTKYGQDFASNEYNNAYNRFNADRDRRFSRLSSIAGYGMNANAANSGAGMNYANNVGNNYTNLANAQGAAKIAGANAWGGALSSIGQMGMEAGMMGMGGMTKAPSLSALGTSLGGTPMTGQAYMDPNRLYG